MNEHKKMKNLWPKSLFSRLAFVWILALLVGHLIGNVYGYIALYDDQIARTDYYLTKDLSVLLPILDTATPAERSDWVKKMQRQAYRYELTDAFASSSSSLATVPLTTSVQRGHALVATLKEELTRSYSAKSSTGQTPDEARRWYFTLKDGSGLIAIVNKVIWPFDWGGGVVFALQVFAVIAFTWLAVRQATRPLLRLAEAAEVLGSSLHCEAIPEDGPSEVARAAVAFNAMQAQIKDQIFAVIKPFRIAAHLCRCRTPYSDTATARQKRFWIDFIDERQSCCTQCSFKYRLRIGAKKAR